MHLSKDEELRGGRDAGRQSAKELVKSINDKFSGAAAVDGGWSGGGNYEEQQRDEARRKEEQRVAKLKKKAEIDSYAECYPG